MFSTEPIAAFLDLCSCYIFWLHLWVNKNVDGCLKYVYNISIYHRSIYSWIESYNFWGICKYRITVYENRYRVESWQTIRFTSLVISDSTAILRSYENSFCVQNPPQNNDFIQQFVSSTSPWHHFGEYHEACYDLNVIRVSVMLLTQNVHVRRVYIQIIA